MKEEEFELSAVKTDHAYGMREDEPIIAPIDLDRRKEEEQRIKMSWVNRYSLSPSYKIILLYEIDRSNQRIL